MGKGTLDYDGGDAVQLSTPQTRDEADNRLELDVSLLGVLLSLDRWLRLHRRRGWSAILEAGFLDCICEVTK